MEEDPMRQMSSVIVALLTIACSLATVACNGSGGIDAVLNPTPNTMPFGSSEIPIVEGLAMGSDPKRLLLDPCAPGALRDPATGHLIGRARIGAVVRDASLRPIAGVAVTFRATVGTLESNGQPVLTDENGLATDVLTIDEDNARTTAVGATTSALSRTHEVPVGVLPTPPIAFALSPVTLGLADRQMYEVVASFPGMECRFGASFVLESVTSNEADFGTSIDDVPNDIQGADIGTADTNVLLRAERADGGTGRTYTIDYRVFDGSGSTTVRTGTVRVP
jgi:hypothetical protein